MRPFDAHVHIGHWTLPDFAGQGSTFDQAVQIYHRWSYSGFLAFPTDAEDGGALLQKAASYRGPLDIRVGFWARPEDATNLLEFERSASSYAVLKLHPSIQRIPATDPQYEPYLEIAESQSMPVVIHCGRWQEMAGYKLSLEVAGRHPKLPIVLAHMGGDSPHLVQGTVDAILEQKLDNAYLGTESIREPWLLSQAVDRLGSSRLIFGSDYNLNHPEPFRRLIEVLDITDAQRDNIFRHNIESLVR